MDFIVLIELFSLDVTAEALLAKIDLAPMRSV